MSQEHVEIVRRCYEAFANTDPQFMPFFSLDEMTLKAWCHGASSGETLLSLGISSTAAADVNWVFETRTGDVGATTPEAAGKSIGANGAAVVGPDLGNSSGNFQRAEGQLIYHNGNRVIALTLHAVANDNSGRCQVTGVAVPTPN